MDTNTIVAATVAAGRVTARVCDWSGCSDGKVGPLAGTLISTLDSRVGVTAIQRIQTLESKRAKGSSVRRSSLTQLSVQVPNETLY